MIEANHQGRNVGAKGDPLVVAPSLSQRVTAVVAPQVDRPAPPLDQPVDRGDRQGPSLALKEVVAVLVFPGGEKCLYGVDASLIEGDPAQLAGLLFPQLNVIPRLAAPHHASGDPQQVTGPKVGVNAHGEKRQVPRIVSQDLLDGGNVLLGLDRIYLDGAARCWPVAVLTFSHPSGSLLRVIDFMAG